MGLKAAAQNVGNPGGTDVAVADGGTGASTALAAAANLGFATKLSQWNVPVGIAPTGTMGNNGAVTLGTALSTTYSNGIWLYYPAGAVAAGVPASATFLWTVMSSTTAGTVYNSTFDGLSVPVAGTTTAYSTTGPGAFAGVTTITTVATITIAANTLGASGVISGDWGVDYNGVAGNKSISLFYSTTGGTDFAAVVGSTQSGGTVLRTSIRNQTTGVQSGGTIMNSTGQAFSSGQRRSAADTTASTTLVFRFTNATATNWVILEGASFFTAQ
jgi:hypothetical protein